MARAKCSAVSCYPKCRRAPQRAKRNKNGRVALEYDEKCEVGLSKEPNDIDEIRAADGRAPDSGTEARSERSMSQAPFFCPLVFPRGRRFSGERRERKEAEDVSIIDRGPPTL